MKLAVVTVAPDLDAIDRALARPTLPLPAIAAELQRALGVDLQSGSITLHFHQGACASVETRACVRVGDLTNR